MQRTPLASLCEILPGYPFRGKVPEAEESDIRVVQIKDVSVELGIRWDSCQTTTLTGKKDPGWLRPGDVLFVAKGNRNFAVSVDHSIERAAIQAVAAPVFYLLRCQAQLLPEYLAWWLNQEPCQRYFEQHAEGSQVKSIRRSVLAAAPLALPPLAQQATLAALHHNLRQQHHTLQQLIANSDQLQRHLANDLLASATPVTP
ncbi:restriction endonuclease subunit S [Aeromonas veronii]|uniref:restriction endonuclease subunit S n=1 Tax=Aeromonas veronii TaxID=654 RepID=UPI003D1B49BD